MVKKKTSADSFGSFGFTILELVVVVAIIALVTTIVVTAISNARRSSRDTQRLASIAQISRAMELYYDNSNGTTYPTECAATINRFASQCTATYPNGIIDYLKTIATVNDPSNSGVATGAAGDNCTSTGPNAPKSNCNYYFSSMFFLLLVL